MSESRLSVSQQAPRVIGPLFCFRISRPSRFAYQFVSKSSRHRFHVTYLFSRFPAAEQIFSVLRHIFSAYISVFVKMVISDIKSCHKL